MAGISGAAAKGRLVSQVWKAVKELNPENVRAEQNRAVRVGLIGPPDLLHSATEYLLGEDPVAYDRAGDALLLIPMPLEDAALMALATCDLVIHSTSYEGSLPGIASERVFAFGSVEDLPAVVRSILQTNALSYTQIPLARLMPGFRTETALQTIQAVSIENAVFVASTSLGNIIPNPLQPLASVAESIGDLVVLTANQIRMMFRLAAIHGRDVGIKRQSPEALSILGAAFGWRSIARELASHIPLGGGVIPKAAIAFAGTWAVGEGIVHYYTTGHWLTRAELKQRFNVAYERGKSSAHVITGKLKDTYVGRRLKRG